MTIGFTALFTKLGKFFNAGDQAVTSATNTKAEIEDAVQGITATDAIEMYAALGDATNSIESLNSSLAGIIAQAVQSPVDTILIETVDADNPLPSKETDEAIDELIRQMEAGSESLDASAVSATPSYGGGNTGTGKMVVSVKRGDGKTNEHCYAEDIEFTHDGTQFVYAGEEAQADKLHPEWPKGSGAGGSATSNSSTSGGNLLAGDFEDEDDNATDLPEGWIADVATLGTTLDLTAVEIQTVIISGTPTSGHYALEFTDRDSKQQTTEPLAYNADESAVESALRALTGLEDVTVATSGTSPNFTHTITFTGTPNPGQLTSDEQFDTGSIAHATSTAGLQTVEGARCLEFDSDGAELTAIYHKITPDAEGQYAFHALLRTDSAPAAGVFTVDLVDGIGGSVIADDESTNNSFTIDATALTTSWASSTGTFRLPSNLPTSVYLRFRISTAVTNTSSVFVDEMSLIEMGEFYSGGPSYAVFDGRTKWAKDDTITLAVTNDRAGAIHEWMNRVFDLMDDGKLFPTDTGGSETIADSLIA